MKAHKGNASNFAGVGREKGLKFLVYYYFATAF